MLLAKSCHSEHNIKRSKTLKIGTLHEYRSTEIKQIADREEGTITFTLKFDGEIEIPIKYFNLLQGAAMMVIEDANDFDDPISFPGHTISYWDRLDYKSTRKGFITLINSSATITRQTLNSFVFCMSSVQEKSECKNMFPDYDDAWFISKENTEYWLRGVNHLLHKKIITEHNKKNYITPKEIRPEDLVMEISHGPVIYTPREVHINNENIGDFEKLLANLFSMSFIKPPVPFIKEKEYRFEFIITHKGMIIEPSVKSIILDAPEFLPIVY